MRRNAFRFVLLTNAIAIVLYMLSSFLPGLHLPAWWYAGFLSLLMPYLAILLVAYILIWLFLKPAWLIPNLAILLLTYGTAGKVIPIHLSESFTRERDSGTLRVMTWNIRSFTPFERVYADASAQIRHGFIFDEVSRFSPDIICFQEFTDAGKMAGNDPVRFLSKNMGYRYYYFPGDDLYKGEILSGLAIFSKYPIVKAGQTRYMQDRFYNNEHTLWADILWQGDTIRAHAMHLQSFRFQPGDYNSIDRISNQEDSGLIASRMIYRKMRSTFIDQGEQSRWLRSILDSSRHPYLVCTDLNNVPSSYAYRMLLGDGKDVFAEKGSGFGKTYTSPQSEWMKRLPTLRIDYIFTQKDFETLQVETGRDRLSDHQAVVADLRLGEIE